MNDNISPERKRLYISGPISGYDYEERKQLFDSTSRRLSRDWRVFNPMENGLTRHASVSQHMRADLVALASCDAFFQLPGWEASANCRLELNVALACGLKIIYD